jgi:hypothetical protein
MSDPWESIRPFYFVEWTEDMGKFWVATLRHRTKDTLRFAYRIKTVGRMKISPETSANTIRIFLEEAKRDRRDGRLPLGVKHRIRIYAREIMPARWSDHRKRMAKRKEDKLMEALPTFGMF